MYTGYFLPLSVQSQSEVIRCISDFADFRQPCILKTAGRKVKLSKIWVSGVSSVCTVLLTVKCSMSF